MMTMNDRLPAQLDTAPFLVVASRGSTRLQMTAGSVLAAAAAAEYWRGLDVGVVDWFLRADLVHPAPVLLFTRRAGETVVHATELMAGKPVSAHAVTCCDTPLHGEAMQPCTPDLAQPCPRCLTTIRLARMFSVPQPQRGVSVGELVSV